MSPIETICLDKIKKGLIRFTLDGQVELFRGRRWFILSPQIKAGSNRRRYRFRMGDVMASRLIYLLTTKQPIPNGHFVDHIDEDCTNDHPTNLQLHKPDESHSQGNRIQTDSTLCKLSRWFELAGNLGREPSLPHELTYVECGF